VDYHNVSVWLKYVDMEMRHRRVNHARNLWDRAVQLLPRVDQVGFRILRYNNVTPAAVGFLTLRYNVTPAGGLSHFALQHITPAAVDFLTLRTIVVTPAAVVQVHPHGGDAGERAGSACDLRAVDAVGARP
jgi:hypothetical protein